MSKTEWVLKYITQSQLSECLNIAIDGDISAAAELLSAALFTDDILLNQEEVTERLMEDLVAEQNSTKIHTRFKIGDEVYLFHKGRLQCYPISVIEIGPEPDSVTYWIWDGKDNISRLEDELFASLEEGRLILKVYLNTLDESLGLI